MWMISNQEDYGQAEVDDFFSTLTDIFVFSLEKGCAEIGSFPVSVKNEHVLSALKYGLNYVQEGIDPVTIRILLEASNLFTFKNNGITKTILLELKLLETLIPYIQNREIQKFLSFSGQICSMHVRYEIDNRLSRFLSNPPDIDAR